MTNPPNIDGAPNIYDAPDGVRAAFTTPTVRARFIAPTGQPSQGQPGEELLPADRDERLALARRLVSERCLYGVDKNPMAVEMAKLSLWLITLAKNRPFTFLDHALRSGDSLLGADERQLSNGSLDAKSGVVSQMSQISTAMSYVMPTVIQKRRQIATLTDRDIHDIETKERLLKESDQALEIVKLGADLLIAIALNEPKKRTSLQDVLGMEYVVLAKGYDEALRHGESEHGWAAKRDGFKKMRDEVDVLLKGRKPFHWPLEFPEVFVGKGGEAGFAAIVSNPPFQGGQKITGALGTDYRDYLVEHLANGKRGSADLCAYFFLRATSLVRKEGMYALLATNTIAQGDTREVGLDQIVASGWTIPRAIPSHKWPGEANLEVAHIWLKSGEWYGPYILNEISVIGITSSLNSESIGLGKPYRLIANANKSFMGAIIHGMGFVLTPEDASILIEKDQQNRAVLNPLLNGEDVNTQPDQSASRWAINFRDWPVERAATYPDCMSIVREKVKPERDQLLSSKDASAKASARFWWHYRRKVSELHVAIKDLTRVITIPLVTKYMVCAWEPINLVFTNTVGVIASDANTDFAIIQSAFHDNWARTNGSTLETRMRYTPGDCFETFPFPSNMDTLNNIGERYYTHRQSIMQTRQEGLTKTYNRFHNPDEHAPDIVKLRELHKEMDEAVAHAYGWDDLKLQHGFHETKQGLRYTISEEARREVLDRLLLLNHQRHEEEVLAGLFEKGAKGKGKKSARKVAKNGNVVDAVMSEGNGVGARFTSPSGVEVPFTNPSRSNKGEDDVQQGTLF